MSFASKMCVAAVAVLAALGGPAIAHAGAARFHAIIIDTSPMAAKGVPNLAARVRAALAPALAQELAGRVATGDRRAPDLVVRVDAFELATTDGSDSFFSGELDYLDGEVSVVSGRNVLETFPLTTRQSPQVAGAWYLPDNEQRRMVFIAGSFAQWVRQKLGG